ncbi:hypothetical protein ACFVIN_22105, partial [Streptomyces prasinus]
EGPPHRHPISPVRPRARVAPGAAGAAGGGVGGGAAAAVAPPPSGLVAEELSATIPAPTDPMAPPAKTTV